MCFVCTYYPRLHSSEQWQWGHTWPLVKDLFVTTRQNVARISQKLSSSFCSTIEHFATLWSELGICTTYTKREIKRFLIAVSHIVVLFSGFFFLFQEEVELAVFLQSSSLFNPFLTMQQ